MSNTPDEYEFLISGGGEHRPKLSDAERNELQSRWERRTFTEADGSLLRADFERALRKHGADLGTARKVSASATCQLIFRFYAGEIADYATSAREGKKTGGFQARGVIDASERPAYETVVRAIKREKNRGTPDKEIPRRVKAGGIYLSLRWIRTLGQRSGLLPRRSAKGKR